MGARVFTHGPLVSEMKFQLCRCKGCGVERTCTPDTDFYVVEGDEEGPLYCLKCLMDLPRAGKKEER